MLNQLQYLFSMTLFKKNAYQKFGMMKQLPLTILNRIQPKEIL
jgi:hypothetical protein